MINSFQSSFLRILYKNKWYPFIHYRPQLSVHVVSLSLCFFLLVFPCSVSSGFIIVLPRKPGKVTVAALIGWVKSASWFPLSGVLSPQLLLAFKRLFFFIALILYLITIIKEQIWKKKHSTVALQRVSRFHPPVIFLLWFVWCWEWQIAQCEAGDRDMAAVVISG